MTADEWPRRERAGWECNTQVIEGEVRYINWARLMGGSRMNHASNRLQHLHCPKCGSCMSMVGRWWKCLICFPWWP